MEQVHKGIGKPRGKIGVGFSESLPLKVIVKTGIRSAKGQLKGRHVEIVMPNHWPKSYKLEVAQSLYCRIKQQFEADWVLVDQYPGPWITFDTRETLATWVHELNVRTLRVPCERVKLGQAKFSRLAQMNIRLKTMTVSRYCTHHVPESALRYLCVHELAHLIEPNHSKSFWRLVKQHVPDYRYQSRLIAAVHRVRLFEAHNEEPLHTCLGEEVLQLNVLGESNVLS